MASHQRLTTLQATEVYTDVLYVGEVRHTNLNPDMPEPAPAPVAPYPAPLPEKLTMVALKERQDYLLAVLVEAGLVSPGPRPDLTALPEGEAL